MPLIIGRGCKSAWPLPPPIDVCHPDSFAPRGLVSSRYMDLRQAQMAKEREEKEAAVEPVYDGPVGAIDDHPFDLPTYPGMQAEVSLQQLHV